MTRKGRVIFDSEPSDTESSDTETSGTESFSVSSDYEPLESIWERHCVRIKDDMIRFSDFCGKILKRSLLSIPLSRSRIDIVNGKRYISVWTAVLYLVTRYDKTVAAFCGSYLRELVTECGYDIEIIEEQSVDFNGDKIAHFKLGDDEWYSIESLRYCLDYRNSKTMTDKLTPSCMKSFSNLKALCNNKQMLVPKEFTEGIAPFANTRGLSIIIKESNKPNGVGLAKLFEVSLGPYLKRHEMQIVWDLSCVCRSLEVAYAHQYHIPNKTDIVIRAGQRIIRPRVIGCSYFKVDFIMPDNNVVVEIDENGHEDRNPVSEAKREKYIKEKLECQLIRVNPDDPNYRLYDLLSAIIDVLWSTEPARDLPTIYVPPRLPSVKAPVKTLTKKTPAVKTLAKKAPAKKVQATKVLTKKAPVKKVQAKKAPAKKVRAKKSPEMKTRRKGPAMKAPSKAPAAELR